MTFGPYFAPNTGLAEAPKAKTPESTPAPEGARPGQGSAGNISKGILSPEFHPHKVASRIFEVPRVLVQLDQTVGKSANLFVSKLLRKKPEAVAP